MASSKCSGTSCGLGRTTECIETDGELDGDGVPDEELLPWDEWDEGGSTDTDLSLVGCYPSPVNSWTYESEEDLPLRPPSDFSPLLVVQWQVFPYHYRLLTLLAILHSHPTVPLTAVPALSTGQASRRTRPESV
jgi:hypothetical protein